MMKRKILSIIVLVLFLFNNLCIISFAENDSAVTIDNISGKNGDIVEVTIKLSQQTDFSNIALEMGYNSNIMTLTGVKSNVVGTSFTTAQSITKNPYNMQWDSASNVSHSGTLATLTFKVKDDAKSGEYPITVDFYKGRNGTNIDGDSVNYKTSEIDKTEYEPIGFTYINGSITIENDDIPTVSGVSVTAGTASGECGDLVELPITLSEELSFSNLSLEVNYDSDVMTLTGVNNAVLDGAFTTAQEMTKNPYNMQWDSANNISASGKIVTLTFRIKRNATSGTYPVTVSYYKGRNGDNVDGYSINYTDSDVPLNLSYENGSITVKENQGGNTPSIGVSGISFMVNLSADSYEGSIYAGLYDDDGRLVSVKIYPADENVFVSFEKGKTGAYVKIMWWNDNMSPKCEAQIIPIH